MLRSACCVRRVAFGVLRSACCVLRHMAADAQSAGRRVWGSATIPPPPIRSRGGCDRFSNENHLHLPVILKTESVPIESDSRLNGLDCRRKRIWATIGAIGKAIETASIMLQRVNWPVYVLDCRPGLRVHADSDKRPALFRP